MKIVFFSRFMTHHLTDVCDELYKLTEGDFYFVETEYLPSMRKNLGYKDEAKLRPYCINIQDGIDSYEKAKQLCIDADVAIIGSRSYEFESIRFSHGNKLTFKLKERLFKKGIKMRYDPKVKQDMYNKHQKFFRNNLYYLCAGTYTATDVKFLGLNENRLVKWGYFPPFRTHSLEDFKNAKTGDTIRILWCGRYMSTKVPHLILPAIRYVLDAGHKVELTYLGAVEEQESKDKVDEYVKRYHLENHVKFLQSVSSDKVRDIMLSSHILVMSSNYEEGWGAVVSEAMNEGCVVISSAAAGATGFLITDKQNGFVFNYRNPKSLEKVLEEVLVRNEYVEIGYQAYQTIATEWNGIEAARRFYELSTRLINESDDPYYATGPCSQAHDIKNMKHLIEMISGVEK